MSWQGLGTDFQYGILAVVLYLLVCSWFAALVSSTLHGSQTGAREAPASPDKRDFLLFIGSAELLQAIMDAIVTINTDQPSDVRNISLLLTTKDKSP